MLTHKKNIKYIYLIGCLCITNLLNINVSAITLDTDSNITLNTLNSSLKAELTTQKDLNNIKDSYYRNEKLKTMTSKEKILELKKQLNLKVEQEEKKEEDIRVVIDKVESNYEYSGVQPITNGQTIEIPSGLGRVHTYMGWQCITAPDSTQYKLKQQAGMNFNEEGFGIINGRYVIACTTTYGNVGDYVDFYQEDGSIIPCIIGDIKSRGDANCNEWGHQNGSCIIEFIVDCNSWYGSSMHTNPGTSSCHPEWNQCITKAVNGGSYFK